MKIYFFAEDVKQPLFPKSLIRTIVKQIASDYNISFSNINVVFCSDEYLLDINIKYLNHNYYTDIITFDYHNDEFIDSDIFISVDRVSENAKLLNLAFKQEICRIIIHGVLHLCGLKDDTIESKSIMTEKENHYLSFF